MKYIQKSVLVAFVAASIAGAQTIPAQLPGILATPLQSPKVVTYQLQEYLLKRIPHLPTPTTAQQWSGEAAQIRQHLLDDVIYHGWPDEWVKAPPKFEDLGTIPSGNGYRIRKLRYEIVPGFYSTALLYEPEKIQGKIPAVLDVMGHYLPEGKAMEFEQKLCINQALRGMIALNLEWIDTGELNSKGNYHMYEPSLDLVGANGVGLFYLAMRRGLDYLSENVNVDPNRIGMTGLSGGGWQTIILSSLDPRVKVAIPVAGFSSVAEKIGRQNLDPNEPGDPEQQPTDFLIDQDYPTLTAMRAPRPTLLINNAEDDCCFRAPLVKPYIFDPIKPFFKLDGKADEFRFYENTEIAGHNYGRDSREQAYDFLSKSFNLPVIRDEVPVGQDVKSYDELAAGVPKNNLTILDLARQMGNKIQRSPIPTDGPGKKVWDRSERSRLESVVRYKPVQMEHPWLVDNTHHNDVESVSYRFQFSNGLSATGVWIKAESTSRKAPLTIILNDKGKGAAAADVWNRLPEAADRLSRGEQVLVLDLMFTGDAAPDLPGWYFAMMLRASGDRPLGMEVAQLIAVSKWAEQTWNPAQIRLESTGMRSQVESLVGAAIEPGMFSQIVIHGGIHSLNYLLEKPVDYSEAPELFCLDLYKYFDVDSLVALAGNSFITENDYLNPPAKP